MVAVFSRDAIDAVSEMFDDVVMAGKGVVFAVESEGDVWQGVDVGAILVNNNIIKDWVQQS